MDTPRRVTGIWRRRLGGPDQSYELVGLLHPAELERCLDLPLVVELHDPDPGEVTLHIGRADVGDLLGHQHEEDAERAALAVQPIDHAGGLGGGEERPRLVAGDDASAARPHDLDPRSPQEPLAGDRRVLHHRQFVRVGALRQSCVLVELDEREAASAAESAARFERDAEGEVRVSERPLSDLLAELLVLLGQEVERTADASGAVVYPRVERL